ncbi:LytS/YhcK type 5TM receptor domain-containing protein [Mammaliicoccus lentus]|jgi:two-component system sensor histidine kinase LytS|uniref:sensor histidine kinase n=1 Tax=Mammaliicoccus TaxID=2803850 RepID=UPI000CD326E6|nr:MULTISPECIES: sensor histidine kinase [Mammaliicoccus]HBV02852.1 sensor histidine kinase [Staphylococcus sp.]MBW0771275.1 sensor histidine kinase [Mammaliicoccus lentus]MCR1873655.1 sensor histidine kinase [Mammaliicoccus lentus]POA04719.1 sensor histidine kinase [Mammaliicoccus lentus]WHI55070.1 sensor histidine kinase [Mammaliicoccus lentus]
MLNLFVLLLERVGLIILVAYILMNTSYFKNMMGEREQWYVKWRLIIVFSSFALLSNFTGVAINNGEVVSSMIYLHLGPEVSLANTRVLTIGVAGMIGGPFVGLFVGVLSGIFRVYIGGADAYTYLISSIVIGLVAGYFGQRAMKSKGYLSVKQSALIGASTEVIQMICILVFSSQKADALELVQLIALPMIIINGLGTAIFMSIIVSTVKQEEQMRAIQTQDVLKLVNQTLPYFKEGLTESSANESAKVIKDLMKVSAVAITNKTHILAHVGVASDHHTPDKTIITDLSKAVIDTGQQKEVYSSKEIGCQHPNCPLEAAIVIPLYIQGDIVGTLKLYFTDYHDLTFVEKRLAEGLAKIFSSQLELGAVETQRQLLQDAEIKSLQAQVNPHFFFNAMNTISALVRIDHEKARQLLLQMSQFFRSNLQGARNNTITISKELEQVRAYIALEQARYPDHFIIECDIPEQYESALVPPFVIQILVENAIKHAFTNRKDDNRIWVKVTGEQHKIKLSVKDNGQGIPEEKLGTIGKVIVESQSGTGSALENLNRRLIGLFGPTAELSIHTSHLGTEVQTEIPYKHIEEDM